MRQRWRVIQDNVLAREGSDVIARELLERLPKGAVLEEVQLIGDALHFKRISGCGPLTGWVDVKDAFGREQLSSVAAAAPAVKRKAPPAEGAQARVSKTAPSLEKAGGQQPPAAGTGREWEVVSEGGVFAQKGQRPSTMKLFPALPGGTVLEEIEQAGDRLHFLNRSGTGPASGWASIKEKGRELLRPVGGYPPQPELQCLDDAKADLYRLENESMDVQEPPSAAREAEVSSTELPEGERNQPLGSWAAMAQLYHAKEPKKAAAPKKVIDEHPRSTFEQPESKKMQESWAALAKRHGMDQPQAAVAAESAEQLRAPEAREELPPLADLMRLDGDALAKLLGLDAVIAGQYVGLPLMDKKRMIDERRTELEGERLKALEAARLAEEAKLRARLEAEAAEAAAARAAEAKALIEESGSPLAGWVAMLGLLDEGMAPGAAVAAETRARRVPKELPPVDDLEDLAAGALAELLGLDPMAARVLGELSVAMRKKIIAEAKALLEMDADKRVQFLDEYQKAWPRGPFPELTPPIDEPSLLPPGSCFPYSRHLQAVPPGPLPEWGLDSPAGVALRTFFRRRATSHPDAQKEFLRSLTCEVPSTGRPVDADAGVASVDPCRVGGLVDKDQISGTVVAKGALRPDDALKYLNGQLQQRTCVLDGDVAARLEKERLGEADYRGERFKNFKETDATGTPIALAGNIGLLNLTKGGLITEIHKEYLMAGADIVRTNTYSCNSISQKDYAMQALVYEMNKAAGQLAKKAAAEVTKQEPAKPRLVAGVLGPLTCMLSLTPGATWAAAVEAYAEQVKGLVDGGVDILMIDGIADSLNAKAAISAIDEHFGSLGRKRPPLLLGAQLQAGGRTPSGQSVEALCISLRHARPLSLGLCSTGAVELKAPSAALASQHTGWCGLCPGVEGKDPEQYATLAVEGGLPNFLGGGAGTLPTHVAALAKRAASGSSRKLPALPEHPHLQLAGLDACIVKPDGGFQVVGSQCSVMGSAGFKKKVGAYKATGQKRYLEEAIEVCLEQCEKGADILDFNLDSDLASGPACPAKGILGTFLKLASAEPKVAKVPFMLCSCDWETIRDGLRHVQGKCVVNGLSLALGEQEFLRIAGECKAHGAALVVLPLTDTCEPAETREDKVRICERSYRLLRSKVDFPAEDIIFDCQVLPLGLPEFAGRAVDFIGAVEDLKRSCPGASFIAGLNNLSLPFRGLNMLRDALHSVFLQHAVPKGVNMAIAWPGALPIYSDLDTETRVLCEEMVLNASKDARHLERFTAFVNFHADTATCLPVRSPGLWVDAGRRAPAVQKEAKEMQLELRRQRQATTPQQQNAALRSLKCDTLCSAEPLKPDEGAGLPDPCRQEGFVDQKQLSATILARSTVRPTELARYLNAELKKRICFLATPAEDWAGGQAGYREYFDAGCDVCGTGTLAATGYEESKAAAQLAKEAAAEATKAEPSKPRFVAGVLGPSKHSLSSPSASDPSLRSGSWEELVGAYKEQIRGLVDGGVDLLALEAVFDTLNAKAAIFAIDEYFSQAKRERPPLLVTAVLNDDGRLPSGQSLEAFLVSIAHARPLSVGVSGLLGDPSMRKAAEALARLRDAAWCHTVGVGSGERLSDYVDNKSLNLAGTRGAPAASLAAAVKAVRSGRPRVPPPAADPILRLAGLEVLEVQSNRSTVQLVGQRCNLGGSRKFRGLMDAYKYNRQGSRWEAALEVCAEQVEAGAELLDLNFDSELIDSKWAMGKFLRLCAAEARISRVPFVLGSAEWPTIEAGLRSVPGKSVVNAISFLQGEEEFLRLAAACRRYGAAVVVVTLDSPEEAPSLQDRVTIGQRAYELLRKRLDFPAEDIIFDCHVTPIDQPGGAKDFVDAVAELKRTCPHVSFIGGVSNLSLPHRGVAPLREALHSLFLGQAVPAGLNLAIVDVGKIPRRGDIEAHTVKLCEEAILNESEDGKHLERLEMYGAYLGGGAAAEGVALRLPYAQPSAITRKDSGKTFTQPIRTLVQATGTITTSIFQNFASKAHCAMVFHKNNAGIELRRQVWYSSISAWMGQGGTGPIAGASLVMDGSALKERWMGYQNMSTACEWGAVGEIGLRRTLYGSRDVFAQFDLGQKLVSPENAQFLMRVLCCLPNDPYEVIGLAFLDQTWQMTLAGVTAGGGLDRKTFAEV